MPLTVRLPGQVIVSVPLACVGVDATRKAFELGQVDELVITANPDNLKAGAGDDFVLKARQTSASVRFIEDASLLQQVGGVGAFLRFKI